MITATKLPNGDLRITAANVARAELAYNLRRGAYTTAEEDVVDALRGQGFDFVLPERVGALTCSPIFGEDASYNDDGAYEVRGDLYWFPDYQITDPWRELAYKGRVVFSRAKES